MLYIRCRRRREYYWTIILVVALVFLYTYLYNIRIGSQDGQKKTVISSKNIFGKDTSTSLHVGASTEVGSRVVSEHKDGDDKYKGSDDKHKGSDDKHKGGDDKHKGSDDKHKGGDDKVTADHNAILKMREEINAINNDEVILNDNKFPPFELVVIVQVHRRTEYLKMLLESLREARDINTVLLVISLDYYDVELFSVVDKIDFCKVIKIS